MQIMANLNTAVGFLKRIDKREFILAHQDWRRFVENPQIMDKGLTLSKDALI